MAEASFEKVFLSGFDIDISEIETIRGIILKYLNKIERICSYNSLNIHLKKTKKGTSFLHEINARIETDKLIAVAKQTELNLFKGVRDVMEKLTHELEHKKKDKVKC